MFYSIEDVTPAVDMATKIFGTVGNIATGKNVLYNVSVATREFGKLWYGDIASPDVVSLLNTLSNFTRQKVYILDESFNYTAPVLTSSN
jgi:hypothetical protein